MTILVVGERRREATIPVVGVGLLTERNGTERNNRQKSSERTERNNGKKVAERNETEHQSDGTKSETEPFRVINGPKNGF
jgi:hypothetical protein